MHGFCWLKALPLSLSLCVFFFLRDLSLFLCVCVCVCLLDRSRTFAAQMNKLAWSTFPQGLNPPHTRFLSIIRNPNDAFQPPVKQTQLQHHMYICGHIDQNYKQRYFSVLQSFSPPNSNKNIWVLQFMSWPWLSTFSDYIYSRQSTS